MPQQDGRRAGSETLVPGPQGAAAADDAESAAPSSAASAASALQRDSQAGEGVDREEVGGSSDSAGNDMQPSQKETTPVVAVPAGNEAPAKPKSRMTMFKFGEKAKESAPKEGPEAEAPETDVEPPVAEKASAPKSAVTPGVGTESVRKKPSMKESIKRFFAFGQKKEPPLQPSPEPSDEPSDEPTEVEEEAPVEAFRASLIPERPTHSSASLVCRERDVRIELLEILVKEHAQLRANLSLGLAGLHGMSRLVAQEEARGIWLKEAIVVEHETIAALDVLNGLNDNLRERITHLDGSIDQGTVFLLQAQTIAKQPRARASVAERVQALLPDVPSGRLELPDLHQMYMLLKAWELNKEGFVVSSDNDGGCFESPSEMIQFAGKKLEQVLQARGSGKRDSLTKLLEDSSKIANRIHEERRQEQLEGKRLANLAQDIEVLDAALENLHDEQYHLEDYLDRALESQVSSPRAVQPTSTPHPMPYRLSIPQVLCTPLSCDDPIRLFLGLSLRENTDAVPRF